MVRIRSLSRASLLLLLATMQLLLASTSGAASLGLGLAFSSQGTNHGQIPQLGSQPDFQMQLVPNQFLRNLAPALTFRYTLHPSTIFPESSVLAAMSPLRGSHLRPL